MMINFRFATAAAVVGLAVAGCGSSSQSASTATTAAKVQPRERTPARGPGRVLGGPLVYRYPGHPAPGEVQDPRYAVFFRTSGAFARRDGVGTTIPGEVRVGDAEDNHDGFQGATSLGSRRGKCYGWNLFSLSPELDAKRVGARVRTSLELPGTVAQQWTVKLGAYPRSEARLSAALRRIGCRPRTE